MNPLTLLNPTTWIVGALAIGLATLAFLGYGKHKYNQGVADTTHTYEIAAAAAEGANQAVSKERFRSAELGAKDYAAKLEVKKVDDAKRDTKTADLQRDVDLLRWALTRRGETPIDPTSACAAERVQLRRSEQLLGESQQLVGESGGLLKEGSGIIQGLDAKVGLARDWANSVKIGEK